MNTVAGKAIVVNETNMTTQETNPVGADAIMWTAPIVQEENGDCLFAYVTPKPKRVDETALMNAVLDSMRIETGRPAECALADQWLTA